MGSGKEEAEWVGVVHGARRARMPVPVYHLDPAQRVYRGIVWSDVAVVMAYPSLAPLQGEMWRRVGEGRASAGGRPADIEGSTLATSMDA
jgi:hypothetical protein